MKKIIILLGAVAALSLGSCKKDYTCKCVNQSGADSYHTIPNASLTDAKRTCDGFEYQIGATYNNCSVE